jgi:uncharacterized protein (DUF2345 family)
MNPGSQSAEITASDGTSGDDFGASVAMSGNTIVVGAPGQVGVGAAYVFTGSGTNWNQVAKLTPSDGTMAGSLVTPSPSAETRSQSELPEITQSTCSPGRQRAGRT